MRLRESSILPGVLVFLFVFAGLMWAQLPASTGAPKVGERVPDFTLPDAHGQAQTLSELIATGDDGKPGWVLLVFYRGYW